MLLYKTYYSDYWCAFKTVESKNVTSQFHLFNYMNFHHKKYDTKKNQPFMPNMMIVKDQNMTSY